MKIAIFTGGDSSEYVISMKSAEQVFTWLEAAGHSCYLVEVKKDMWNVHLGKRRIPLDKNSFSFLNKEEKITFLFSTHDQRVIKKARRVITLVDGKIDSDVTQTPT